MILYPAALFAVAAVAARSVGSIVGTLLARRVSHAAPALSATAAIEETPIYDALVAERDAFERQALAEIEALVNEWRSS